MKERKRFQLTALVAAAGLIATTSGAVAQSWYFINRHPAPNGVAHQMAAARVPYGYYWLRADGSWGAEGDATVIGNIRGLEPTFSEPEQLD